MGKLSYTTFTTPSGDEMIVMPRAEFDELRDALDAAEAARAIAEIAAGKQELLTEEETRAALAAPSLLAFWRAKRGLTQSELARRAGISQSYLALIEGGRRVGDAALYLRLARALNVRVEDLIEEAGP